MLRDSERRARQIPSGRRGSSPRALRSADGILFDWTWVLSRQRSLRSTYWTESIGPTAAVATLARLEKLDVAHHVGEIGALVRAGWAAAATRHGVPADVIGIPALCILSFDAQEISRALMTLFTQEMLARGFLAAGAFYPTCPQARSGRPVSGSGRRSFRPAPATSGPRHGADGLARTRGAERFCPPHLMQPARKILQLGCGSMGSRRVRDLSRRPDVEVRARADRWTAVQPNQEPERVLPRPGP